MNYVTQRIPTMRQRRLGQLLRELREAAGVKVADAAHVLDCSQPKLSRIETGTNAIGKQDLRGLLEYYSALDRLDVLEDLRREAGQRGWWMTTGLPDWLKVYLSAESEATSVDCFMLELVHGLLQTEAYARAAYERHGASPGEADHGVTARLRRQVRLGEPDFSLRAILSEGVLCRTLHMGDLGLEQLRHLRELAQLPRVELRILPWASGGHRSMASCFTLLHYPKNLSRSIVHQEFASGGRLTDEPELVDYEVQVYEALRRQVLPEERSLALLSDYIEKGG
jgi:transcriptional regulator with XRE-family HTH domain